MITKKYSAKQAIYLVTPSEP